MSALRNLQGTFADFLLGRASDIAARVQGGPHADARTLLGIYRNAYRIRLVKVLREDFKRLRRFLGDAVFDRMAAAYLTACPSRSFSVRWLGDRLPDFLATTDPWALDRAITQLAQIEWAQSMAFDAADEPLLARETLASVAPGDWPSLVLALHPSVQILSISPDIFVAWQQLGSDDASIGERPAALAPDAPLLVWRLGLDVKLRPLETDEADMLEGIVAGEPFAALCERIAAHVGTERAAWRTAELLERFVAAGMLGSANVARTGSM